MRIAIAARGRRDGLGGGTGMAPAAVLAAMRETVTERPEGSQLGASGRYQGHTWSPGPFT